MNVRLLGLHTGPNNICYITRHFLFFSMCPHVTFYKALMSLSTVIIKGHVGFLQLLKWQCRTSFFTHVELCNAWIYFCLQFLHCAVWKIKKNTINALPVSVCGVSVTLLSTSELTTVK